MKFLACIAATVTDDDLEFMGHPIIDAHDEWVVLDVDTDEIDLDYTVTVETDVVEFWGQRSVEKFTYIDVHKALWNGLEVLNADDLCNALEGFDVFK